MGQLERGSHQIVAVILDESQKMIKGSNTVSIFVHQATLNSPARQSFKSNSNFPLQSVINFFHTLQRG